MARIGFAAVKFIGAISTAAEVFQDGHFSLA